MSVQGAFFHSMSGIVGIVKKQSRRWLMMVGAARMSKCNLMLRDERRVLSLLIRRTGLLLQNARKNCKRRGPNDRKTAVWPTIRIIIGAHTGPPQVF